MSNQEFEQETDNSSEAGKKTTKKNEPKEESNMKKKLARLKAAGIEDVTSQKGGGGLAIIGVSAPSKKRDKD